MSRYVSSATFNPVHAHAHNLQQNTEYVAYTLKRLVIQKYIAPKI